MIEDPQLHQLFEAESAEHLSRLDDGLLRLEKNGADHEVLEEVFREAHSLKGAARMLGLSRIESAAHGLESILNTARRGEAPITPDAIERMTAVLRDLRGLVQQVLAEKPAASGPAEESDDAQAAPAAVFAATPFAPPQEIQPDAPPAAVAVLKEESAPRMKPPQAHERPPQAHEHPPPSRADSAAGEPFHIDTVRVETQKLDDLLTLTGEIGIIKGRAQHRLALMDEMSEQWSVLERNRKKFQYLLRGPDGGDRTNGALRKMLQADGEALVLLGTRIKQARDAFYEDGARLDATASTLEESVQTVRMVPLSVMFSLFPRMVRDLSRELHKEVDLVVEGGELNVDKRILEEMKDPLMHLLRNAIDHGIELADERLRRGKPRGGALRLSALKEGNNLLLEVRDDGRGLDMEAIRHAALQQGLYDAATLAAMSVAQLQQLILLPGFSTSGYVTEMSGRGVGMDVVRVNVERLKGEIRMESARHQGTMIQLRLPLGLSTTRLMLAEAGGHLYGLPIEFIHTARRVSGEDIFTLEGRPAFEMDGQAVLAPRLADLLELPDAPVAAAAETACIVIRVGNERLGVRVNELRGEEDVLTKPLGAPLKRVRNVSGMAILGSGEICAVLNPTDLIRQAHKPSASRSGGTPEQAQPHAKPCILLVEDTVLVRVMEKRILESAGYEVVAAVDGAQALGMLGGRQFAAVVSDINMPIMDGLTLTARIRQEPGHRDLPVILVTALASDDDRRRGMEAGANAYIPKPSFDQRVLLDTLRRLVAP
jgi:two-component system chemotaxis sensor kinase CheA